MRYILDDYGYISEVTFGGYIQCNNKGCTEYIGAVPSGYSSLEDWHENANIRAYKLVDDNLVYDADKDVELQALFELEARKNKSVTHGELDNTLSNLNIESSNQEELAGILPTSSESGDVITLSDSSSYPMERIAIECNEAVDSLNLYISTSNMLPVETLSGSKNGITYVTNEDKSIFLIGSSDDFSLDISGSAANRNPLFILKAGETYYIDGLANVTLNMYTHDGTDRILYYTATGTISITPEEDVPITHTEITCTGEIDEKLELMISAKTTLEYEPCEYAIVPIDLNGHTAEAGSVIEIEDGVIILDDGGINIIEMPCTFYENTTMYLDKNASLDIDYKKSGFDTVTRSGSGVVKLRNTADGYGSIFTCKLKGLEGGSTYTLESSDGGEQVEQYTINLEDYTGEVDVVIDKGQASVYQDDVIIGFLDSIYIKTYSPSTKIRLVDCTNKITCEYMVESEFSVYCTRVEKDASIKMLDDKITLEVKRASEVEGSLYGAIEVEADRITQIVSSVGTDGKVTAASIIAAVNEDESSLQLKADKIDITGKTLPTISNEEGSCLIESQGILSEHGNPMIRHRADVHQFEYYEDTEFSDFRIITKNFHFLGWGEFRVTGDFYLNGEKVDFNLGSDTSHAHDDLYHTKEEIDTKIGDVQAILELLNGTPTETTDGHNHNNRYYTEAEINLLLEGIEETLNTLNSGGGVA